MTRIKYTPERIAWIRAHREGISVSLLAEAFSQQFQVSISGAGLKTALHRLGIRSESGSRTPKLRKPGLRLLTPEQAAFAAARYQEVIAATVAAEINQRWGTAITPEQMRTWTKGNKVRAPRDGKFKPGHSSTKGKRGLWKGNSTSFKAGNLPSGARQPLPIGHTRLTKDGYIEVKLDEINPYTGYRGRFVQLHRHLWEQAHGPIPPDMVVGFNDGNPSNCTLDNLILLSREDLGRLNIKHGYGSAPAELKPALRTIARIESVIRARRSKQR